MAYNPADLSPGQIILCLPTPRESLAARALDAAIAWSTDGPFVHAAMAADSDHLIEQVATIRLSPLDAYAANGWAFSVAGASPAQASRAVDAFRARLGQPYGIMELLAMGGYYDLHAVRLATRHSRWTVCSTAVERAWRAAGIILSERPLVAPNDLAFSPVLLGSRPWRRD